MNSSVTFPNPGCSLFFFLAQSVRDWDLTTWCQRLGQINLCWSVGVEVGGATEGVCAPPLLFVRACAQALICHEGGPTGLV